MKVAVDYKNVPVELCKYALSHHKVNQVRLYVFLKSKCSGHIKLPKERIKDFSLELGYKSTKTFHSNLKWLVHQKWITINNKSGSHRIKGFLEIANKLKFGSVKGAIFEPLDFSKFKGFLAASVITYHMELKSRSDLKKQSEYVIGCSRKYCSKQPAFFSLPHTYLAKILNVSPSCAKKYRNAAVLNGFLTAKHNFKDLNIPVQQSKPFIKYVHPQSGNIKQFNNKLVLQLNDTLESNIILRTKHEFKKGLLHKWKKSTPLILGV